MSSTHRLPPARHPSPGASEARARVPRPPPPRGAALRLTMAAARLPDRLVPRRERTAVSQERAGRSCATATTSSSKRKACSLRGCLYSCARVCFRVPHVSPRCPGRGMAPLARVALEAAARVGAGAPRGLAGKERTRAPPVGLEESEPLKMDPRASARSVPGQGKCDLP